MTRTHQRTSVDAEHCFEESQLLCDRILAQALSPAEVQAYAAGLMVRAVETVLPSGERALFLTHLARHRRAQGRGVEADQARVAAAAPLQLPAADARAWLAHLSAVPSGGPGRPTWLFRHLHRLMVRLGVTPALEGELARALAWRYLTSGMV